MLAAAALALGFCTKETFPISVFGIGLGGLVAALVGRRERAGQGEAPAPGGLAAEARSLGRRLRPHLLDAVLLAAGLWFLLFSSFFLHMKGPIDSLRAYAPWADTAAGSGHDKSWDYYATQLIGPWEPALASAGVLGLGLAVVLRSRVGLQLATWTLAVLGVYSAIPYKTPWLVLNALLPLGLLGGWGVERSLAGIARRGLAWRVAGAGLLLALVGLVGWQATLARRLVYLEPDAPGHAYVYVQTRRDVRRLLDRIAAAADPARPGELAIDVVASDYWPLPFYLEPYAPRFWGELGEKLDAPVVIADLRQRVEVSRRLGSGWTRLTYDLRPGVKLDLYTKADVP
jgi:uncharacterized protein (TIGR03663 family)